MKLRGIAPDFDAYAEGYRHTVIVLTNEPGDGWDIAEYFVKKGFADATVLSSRAAKTVLKRYKDIISKVQTISDRNRTFVDIVLNNLLFEWNGKHLIPITYLQAKDKGYLFAHIIRVYRVV